jgi:arginine decarboxylase
MNIYITYGLGEGLTKLAAFDAALFDAGIADYNLIKLTSIIPRNSRVIIKKWRQNEMEVGHRLYVVLSYGVQDEFGKTIYVGLGWNGLHPHDWTGRVRRVWRGLLLFS